MKRLFDFSAALVGLIVLSPLLLLLAAVIKLYDSGPVFFVHTRVGRDAEEFKMFKFRTMVVDAGTRGSQLTVGADKRITPVGRFLRATKCDELPQLWNVVCGQMSLVGPRPEVAEFVQYYSTKQREVLLLQPGITDPASFAFYNESELLAQAADPEKFYREQLMGEKIRINLEYAARATVVTDLIVIFATVAKIFGVHVDIFKRFAIQPSELSVK